MIYIPILSRLRCTLEYIQKKYKNYYRLLSKRFPFAIYYRIEDKNTHIDAVLDCRRDPTWIRDKLK